MGDRPLYVGAPTYMPRLGRSLEVASCGHPVWVSKSWYRAEREGKRLICLDCQLAVAEEHGAALLVWHRAET